MQGQPERRNQLVHIERRSWQLWGLSVSMTAALTFGIALLLYPALEGYAEHVEAGHRGLPQLVLGLIVLVILGQIYTVMKQRELNAFRNFIVASYASAGLARENYPHDSLTGLLDRSSLPDLLKNEKEREDRLKIPFSLALFDLNDFRRINAREGNLVGDLVLREFALVLRRTIRQNDAALRYGPDEFLCVLEGCPRENVLAFVGRVKKGCECVARLRAVGFSVGLAECGAGQDPEEALAQAESELAGSKTQAQATPVRPEVKEP